MHHHKIQANQVSNPSAINHSLSPPQKIKKSENSFFSHSLNKNPKILSNPNKKKSIPSKSIFFLKISLSKKKKKEKKMELNDPRQQQHHHFTSYFSSTPTTTNTPSPPNGLLPPHHPTDSTTPTGSHLLYPHSMGPSTTATVTGGGAPVEATSAKRKRGRPRKYGTPELALAAKKTATSASVAASRERKEQHQAGSSSTTSSFSGSSSKKSQHVLGKGFLTLLWFVCELLNLKMWFNSLKGFVFSGVNC